MVSENFTLNPTQSTSGTTTYKILGLPAGMTYSASTGIISGRANIPGTYKVTIYATNSAGTTTRVVLLTVAPLPTGTAGTYMGAVEESTLTGTATALLGRIDCVVTTAGGFTGTLLFGREKLSFTGRLSDMLDTTPQGEAMISRTGRTTPSRLVITIDPSSNSMTGVFEDTATLNAGINAWRSIWTISSANAARGGIHNFAMELPTSAALPLGYGFGTYTVGAYGKLTVAVRMPDTTVITTAGFISSNGQVLVHAPLYANATRDLGQVSGVLSQALDTAHTVSGVLKWSKPTGATNRTYATGFPITEVPVVGGRYAYAGGIVMGLDAVVGNAKLTFSDAGISNTATSPDLLTGLTISKPSVVKLPTTNLGKTTLAITYTTGAFTGTFTLVDQDPYVPAFNITRKVTYYGIIVPTSSGSSGYGCYLLQQLPEPLATPPTTMTSTPFLAGNVLLERL
jgi:PKD repeat protein